MTLHFFLDVNRILAGKAIEIHRLADRLRRSPGTANHLDQRNEMGRIERMADDAALRVFAFHADTADQEPRRTGSDHRFRRQGGIESYEQFDLEILALGPALLHE